MSNGRSDAIISVVFAIIAIPAVIFWGVFTVVLSSAAIYFGIRARKRSARDIYDTTTPVIAATGIVMGIIMLAVGVLIAGALLIGLTYIFTAS